MHTPTCLNCDTYEVSAPYTFRDGTGFCSAQCQSTAYGETTTHSYEVDDDYTATAPYAGLGGWRSTTKYER